MSPKDVKIGQHWSTWVPGRRQWLLSMVVAQGEGRATLQYDARYGIAPGYDRQRADEFAMLNTPTLFRFIEDEAARNSLGKDPS